ncbi:TIGR01212 family radical SAM protein [Haloferula sp. A504]|uniref:TIGR01212 family radical SAM protein n=1 Tax=Haloferula sp. A504 TaxID=3373601 RepID=UPI0031BC690F|nr:TIGR01212 family radical SAM protein [Verrucomicrobiaceae bacterium E54]
MEKAYRSYGAYLKGLLGCRTCKLTLDAGFSCPNRDGTKAWGGCIFCDPTGSSSRAQDGGESIAAQLLDNLGKQRRRFKARKFIAYFQSFTNTYAPVDHLKVLYDEACAAHEDIVGLAISTRPDCVDAEKLDLIASYRERLPYVSVEYGLQTIHDRTLERINRAETHADFLRAYEATRARGLDHCAHVVLDLPGESWEDQMATADRLAELGVNGVKIHLLCAMEGTVLARQYERGEWQPLDPGDYPALVCDFLERLHPECVIHRVAGNGHHEHIVAPRWLQRKHELMQRIDAEFARRGTRQGSRCRVTRP